MWTHVSKNDLYNNYVSHLFGDRHSFDGNEYAKFSETTIGFCKKYLPEDKNARILDAGCGPGFFLYALREHGYVNAHGVDLSEEMVQLAKKENLDVTQGDVFELLRNANSTYDLIVSTDVLEHLRKDELLDYVSLIAKALKPGGLFISSVPNADWPFAMRLRYQDLTHENSFTRESYRQLLLFAGMSWVHVEGNSLPPDSPLGVARFVVSRICRVFWRIFVFAEMGKDAIGLPLDFRLIGVARK